MGKYISCGQFNKNIKYIILGCFFNILVNLIFGFDLDDDFKALLLFPSEGQKILYKHSSVHEIFRNIGVFIFACFFYKIDKSSFPSAKSTNDIILIFNDSEDEMNSISILNFIFIITIYVCTEYLSDIFFQLGLKL